MEQALYASRFVHFTAAMVLFGSSAFGFYALGGSTSLRTVPAFDKWLRRTALAAAIIALVSGLAVLFCQAAEMAGSAAAAYDPETIGAVLFETRFGRVWFWHLLIALALVPASLGPPSWRQPLVFIFSLLLLATLGWVGHAVIGQGGVGIAHTLNQTVHLLAAGLWLGGLAPVAWLLRQARAAPQQAGIALVRDALSRFSRMGYAAVALIALTGAVNTLLLVGSPEAMISTPYGRLLAVKILLFISIAAVAIFNRLRLAPRLSRDPKALGALSLTVGLEQILGLCILGAVSVLGTWPPGMYGG